MLEYSKEYFQTTVTIFVYQFITEIETKYLQSKVQFGEGYFKLLYFGFVGKKTETQ